MFHSFEQFSVPTGGTAYFNNAANIQNIFSRVTGSSVSDIDGLLQANGVANLFLINPNGIICGPNASLDIGGSFVGSTASSLKFADDTQFSATAPTTTQLLTISVPISLQFGGNTGRILVQGNGQGTRTTTDLIDTTVGLRVQPNQTLALVGGDMALEGGTLKTSGGRIELGSVASPSLVSLIPTTDQGWALGYASIPTFGDIQLSGGAVVDASGAGGGDVQVRGRRLMLKDGSQIEASTLGAEAGGTLNVTTSESVEVIGTTADGQSSSGLFAQVYPGATGTGGNLTLKTGRLLLRDGAAVSVSTRGGAGGKLSVTASDAVEVIGTSADGQFSSGLYAQAEGDGNAGDLTITTGRLLVRDEAQVSANTFGTGDGGTLSVTASNAVEVIGTSADGQFVSGLSTQTEGAGAAGDLTITTGRLLVRDEAQVSANTFGIGNGGNISIESIQLNITEGAGVAVDSQGTGNAGNLLVQSGSVTLDSKAFLSAAAASGLGGNIELDLQKLLLMRRNSLISATSGSLGNEGNITIDTSILAAVEDSDIIANAFAGPGANIQITASGIFGTQFRESLTPESDITATGTVTFNTPDYDPSERLVALPVEIIDASELIANSCIARSNQQQGSFIITGAGSLPTRPGDAAVSLYPTGTVRSISSSDTASEVSPNVTSIHPAQRPWQIGDPIVEPQGVYRLANGELVLSRECSH